MGNESNLDGKGFDSRTTEEQRKIATMGGKASGEARRRKRDLRLALEMLLEKPIKDRNGNEMTGTEAITAKLFEQALKGNIKAFETIRSTVGQDAVQQVEMTNHIDKAEALKELRELIDDE